jgi:hypothetical protein
MRMEFDFCKFHYSTVHYAELPVWDFLCHFYMQIHLQILAGDIHVTVPQRMQISWWWELSVCGMSSFVFFTNFHARSNTVLLKVVFSLHPWDKWKSGLKPNTITVMCRLTTGIHSEKCVVRWLRCCSVIQCTYTNLYSIAYYRYASLDDGDTFWEMRH